MFLLMSATSLFLLPWSVPSSFSVKNRIVFWKFERKATVD